jgi:hypothetical protein
LWDVGSDSEHLAVISPAYQNHLAAVLGQQSLFAKGCLIDPFNIEGTLDEIPFQGCYRRAAPRNISCKCVLDHTWGAVPKAETEALD